MKAFVLAETESAARELCAGARTLADEVVLAKLGAPVTGVADKCLTIAVPEGAVADDAYVTVNAAFDAEGASIVLAEPAARILSLVGRLAAHLGTAAITDVQSIEGGVATSMYFGGAGVRQAKAAGDKAVYTVAAGTFDASAATGTDAVEELAWQAPAVALTKTGSEELPPSDVNLQGADVIIGCGRGFAQQDDLQMARDLAAKTGAELACTRPLTEGVDWFPRETYLGVSGQIVAPKTYFALGLSGQMQHMVGVTKAGTIIAVNKDKNAPVFKQCDLGFVGDLKTVLPELTAAL